MPRPNNNAIIAQYHGTERLLAAPSKVERILLRHIIEYCRDRMHPMITRDSISNGLFDANGYPYSAQTRADVQRVVGRAWKALDDSGFIDELDPDNGKNGYRVPSATGKEAFASTDYVGAGMRSKFTREMFHPGLPDAAWNAFTVGDRDLQENPSNRETPLAVGRRLGGPAQGWQTRRLSVATERRK